MAGKVCVAGGMHGKRGACMAGGGMHGRRGALMAGGMCVAGGMHGRRVACMAGETFEGLLSDRHKLLESLFINFKQTKRFSDIKQYLQTFHGLFVPFTETLLTGFGLCPGL